MTQIKIQQLKAGFVAAVPISLSTCIFGALFGIIAVQSGLTMIESTAMSVISFAGAAQLSILPLIGEVGLGTIFFLTFLLNARHLLYGLSLTSHVRYISEGRKHIIGFLLSDSMYALANYQLKTEKKSGYYLVGLGLTVYVAWSGGTLVGAILTNWLGTTNTFGLTFASTACFIILLVAELTTIRRLVTCLICGVFVLIVAPYVSTGILLLLSGILSFSIGVFVGEDDEYE